MNLITRLEFELVYFKNTHPVCVCVCVCVCVHGKGIGTLEMIYLSKSFLNFLSLFFILLELKKKKLRFFFMRVSFSLFCLFLIKSRENNSQANIKSFFFIIIYLYIYFSPVLHMYSWTSVAVGWRSWERDKQWGEGGNISYLFAYDWSPVLTHLGGVVVVG